MMAIVRLPRIRDYWSRSFAPDFFKTSLGIPSHRFCALSKSMKFSDPAADAKKCQGRGGL